MVNNPTKPIPFDLDELEFLFDILITQYNTNNLLNQTFVLAYLSPAPEHSCYTLVTRFAESCKIGEEFLANPFISPMMYF